SVPLATLPDFVQPVLELKHPPKGIRAEAATPGGYLPQRRFGMRPHPTRHLKIVGAGGNKVTQRRRLETGGSEKPAIHRTIVMIRARAPVVQHGICLPAEPQRSGTRLRAVHTGCVERSHSNQAQGYAI